MQHEWHASSPAKPSQAASQGFLGQRGQPLRATRMGYIVPFCAGPGTEKLAASHAKLSVKGLVSPGCGSGCSRPRTCPGHQSLGRLDHPRGGVISRQVCQASKGTSISECRAVVHLDGHCSLSPHLFDLPNLPPHHMQLKGGLSRRATCHSPQQPREHLFFVADLPEPG